MKQHGLSKIIFTVIGTIIPLVITAQKLEAELDFKTRFDNREYNDKFSSSQTIFGIKLVPQIGLRWDRHSVMAGGDFNIDFGDKDRKRTPEFIFYYSYQDERFGAHVGIVPRNKTIGYYPDAFLSDSIKFYDSNIEGFLLQYYGRKGYIEAGLDWNSMISDNVREKFLIFSSGMLMLRDFQLGYYATVYHHAATYRETGVVDNILFYPYAGYAKAWGETRKPITAGVRVGWLQAVQNDRRYVGKYVKPGGVQADLSFEWNKLGAVNTIYIGKGLMPYYDVYGPGLYWGDPFYRTTKDVYNKLQLYWHPVRNNLFDLRISSVHHYDGDSWGWQQLAVFRVVLNRANLKEYRYR